MTSTGEGEGVAQVVRLLGRVVVASAAVLVMAAAPSSYAAGGDHNPPGSFTGTPSGTSTAGFGGNQSTSHTSQGSTGTSGTSSPSSTTGGSTGGLSTPYYSGNIAPDACNPAEYPNGYAPGLALPAPCIQPTGGGRAPPQAPARPVITVQMVTDAATATAPTAPPHVEPGNRSYVNIPNNYWTDAPTVRTSVTVLGRAIPLTWTPSGTTWDFGDGSTATGTGIEDAALGEPGAVEHAYLRQGAYDITTSTTYNLTFVLPGKGAQTMALTSPPSAPVTLPVSEIQTRVSYAR